MAWISVVSERVASAELKAAYDETAGKRGRIWNILAIHSVSPGAMLAHLRLYLELMFGRSGLSRAERETLALAVSSANACQYCIHHHGEALRKITKDDELVASIARDPLGATLSPRSRALVSYAVKLTLTPAGVSSHDIEALREIGLTDRGIHDAASVIAYFNFVNRTALGLGVELEK